MLQITDNNVKIPNKRLFDIANEHFQYLNPKTIRGKYASSSIIEKIKNAILIHSDIEKEYFQFLLGKYNTRIKDILCGRPEILDKIICEFKSKFPPDFLVKYNSETNKIAETPIGKETKKIFNYTIFRQSTQCIKYLEMIGYGNRIACPYCNLDEISIIKKISPKNKKQALLDLDHFTPKSKYPFLSLSFYNLIPSCQICNSRFKGDELFLISSHINPFHKSFDEEFEFTLKKPFISKMDINDLIIEFRSKNGFPTNSIKDLGLMERYETAKDKLYDALEFLTKYPTSKKKEIAKIFGEEENNLLNDFFKIANIPEKNEDIVKYSLGKLKRDICKDNNLIIKR